MNWCNAYIVPLYKSKDDKYECSNSRGISLSSVKVLLRGLIKRVRAGTERTIGEEQYGIRQSRECTDQGRCVESI